MRGGHADARRASRAVEALTGTTLEMTIEADALRRGDDNTGWVAPPPLLQDGGVSDGG